MAATRASRTVAIALLSAVCALGACKNQPSPPPPPPPAVPAMPAVEQQRATEACASYVAKVCACATTVAAAKPTCDLAKALPEAVKTSLEVAASPDSKPADVLGAQDSVRKTAKECIEQLAKLPTLGCP